MSEYAVKLFVVTFCMWLFCFIKMIRTPVTHNKDFKWLVLGMLSMMLNIIYPILMSFV